MKLLSVAGFVMMVGGIVALVLRHELFSPSPVVIGVQLAAFALMVWARVVFKGRSFHAAADPTEGGLVTTGPYRWIRHPIYTAVCGACWAGVLAHPSGTSLLAGVVVIAGSVIRMLVEERLLVERYPAYRQYARVTKRMVPYLF